MLSTHFYNHGAPDTETQQTLVSLSRRFLFINQKTMQSHLSPMLKLIFNTDYSQNKDYASKKLLVTLMSVKIHDFFLNQPCENFDLQLFYIIILRYFGSVTVANFPDHTLKIYGYFLHQNGYTILVQFIRESKKNRRHFHLIQATLLFCEIVALLEMNLNENLNQADFEVMKQNYYVIFLRNQWTNLNRDLSLLLKCGPVTTDTLKMWIALSYVKFKYSKTPERYAFSLIIDIISLIKSLKFKRCHLEDHFYIFLFQMLTVRE